MHRSVAEILHSTGGLISRRDHPELGNQIDVAARRGELVSALPSVYVHRDMCSDWHALARAVGLWDKDAVIVGEAAAALTFWAGKTPRTVEVAARRTRVNRPGLTFIGRVIPPELVMTRHHLRISTPALTAIDLAPRHHGDSIDDALRTRMATLPGMYRALELTQGRSGHITRRRLLLDSRAEPWSRGERLAHGHLRRAGITGWNANVPIICDGFTFYQDIAMDDGPIVGEIDGKAHMRPEKFESDRWRGNLLLLAGKQVLHYTYRMLVDEPDWFVSTWRRAVERYR